MLKKLEKDLISTFVPLGFTGADGHKRHKTEYRESFVTIAIVHIKGDQLENNDNVT